MLVDLWEQILNYLDREDLLNILKSKNKLNFNYIVKLSSNTFQTIPNLKKSKSHDNMIPKSSQNDAKIIPKSYQNDAEIIPK